MTIARLRYRMRTAIAQSPVLCPKTQEDRNALMLYLNTALIGVPSGGIMAFMPVFLARLGASETAIGWLTSAPALMMVFLALPGAAIAERFADQVRVRCTCFYIFRAVFLLCAIAPWFVPEHALPTVLIILWAARMLPNAIAMPAWTTVISNAVSPARRARLNGTRWALLSLVSAASSAIFGRMLDAIAFPLNYQIVFLISFVLGVIDPIFFGRVQVPLLEVRAKEKAQRGITQLTEFFGPVLANKRFLKTMAVTFPYRVMLHLPTPLFSIFWVNELRATDTLIGLRGTVGHIALMVAYMAWGRLASKLGDKRVLWTCAVGLAAYPVTTALLPSAGWIPVVAILWGATVAGIDISLFDLMLSVLPKERTPLFSAVWSMSGNAAMFLGPLLGAALSEATSVATALTIAGGLQIAMTLLFAILPGRATSQPEPA